MNLNGRKWIALFSQTGSEIINISKRTGVYPNLILTNNYSKDTWHKDIFEQYHLVSRHHGLMNVLRGFKRDECVVTLHGYLRILTPDVCLTLDIFNGHPAPIHIYSDLKGLNKQEDQFVYKNKYKRIGSVIHKVTPVLDDGEIIIAHDRENDLQSIDDAYTKLKEISLETWVEFFGKYLMSENKNENWNSRRTVNG